MYDMAIGMIVMFFIVELKGLFIQLAKNVLKYTYLNVRSKIGGNAPNSNGYGLQRPSLQQTPLWSHCLRLR